MLHRQPIHCNFCGKNEDEVSTLVTGFHAPLTLIAICDECVELAHKIVAKQKIKRAGKDG